ncbi:MAG: sporulation/spore germination protein, partial [Cyanobacteria bacterium P01_D01_bin.73]
VPKTVTVQGDRPIEVAVGRVLVEVASDNLDLRGYRLTMDTKKRTVAIALRLRPGTGHKFMALSSCEQLTLFGSVRETLIQNPQWPIDHVTFTNGTKTIRL